MPTIRTFKSRLLKLAKHLESGKLGHKRFDFGDYNVGGTSKNPCGTAGCALGECPIVFPKDWTFYGLSLSPRLKQNLPTPTSSYFIDSFDYAEFYFGISGEASHHLFMPNSQYPEIFGGKPLGAKATRKQVANNIREFVKIYKWTT